MLLLLLLCRRRHGLRVGPVRQLLQPPPHCRHVHSPADAHHHAPALRGVEEQNVAGSIRAEQHTTALCDRVEGEHRLSVSWERICSLAATLQPQQLSGTDDPPPQKTNTAKHSRTLTCCCSRVR